jgi:hypothetical protein
MTLSQGIIGKPFKTRMVSSRDDDWRQLLGHIDSHVWNSVRRTVR